MVVKVLVIFMLISMFVYAYALAVSLLTYVIEEKKMKEERRAFFLSIGMAVFSAIGFAGLAIYQFQITFKIGIVITVLCIVSYVLLSFYNIKRKRKQELKEKINNLLEKK